MLTDILSLSYLRRLPPLLSSNVVSMAGEALRQRLKTKVGLGVAEAEAAAARHPVAPHYRAPRHPIVLCHGLFGFDKMGPDAVPALQIHYWGRIREGLERMGARVVVARVSPTAGIERRAAELDAQLTHILPGSEVNFFAHSMGGLDCRHLLSHLTPTAYTPRSLTTIATPHRGSPFMDWLRDHVGLGVWERALERPGKGRTRRKQAAVLGTVLVASSEVASPTPPDPLSYAPTPLPAAAAPSEAEHTHAPADLFPLAPYAATALTGLRPMLARWIPMLDEPAYGHLTTSYLAQEFNPSTPDVPGLGYYSWGARAPHLSPLHPLRIPWEVVSAAEGPNDGLVSLQSSRWGRYLGTVEADHWEVKDHSANSSRFNALEFYSEAATKLYQEGY